MERNTHKYRPPDLPLGPRPLGIPERDSGIDAAAGRRSVSANPRVLLVVPEALEDAFEKEQAWMLTEQARTALSAPGLNARGILSLVQKNIGLASELVESMTPVDLVHVVLTSPDRSILTAALPILLGRFFGKKVLVDFRHPLAELHLEGTGQTGRWLLSLADAVAAPEDIAGAANLGLDNRVFRTPLGFDPAGIIPRRVGRLQPHILTALRAAHVGTRHRLERAFTLVKSKYPRAEMTIVALGGDAGGTARRKPHGIHFERADSAEALRGFFRDADLFLAATPVGGAHPATMMALAAGLPIVATPASGGEILINRDNGLIADGSDAGSLADRVIELIESPDLAAELSSQGPLSARRYVKAQTQRVWRETYRKLLR